MFCMKCGKKIDDDSKFCPFCGNRIEGVTNSNEINKSSRVKPKKLSKNAVIGISACALALVAVIVVLKIFIGLFDKPVTEQQIEDSIANVESTNVESDEQTVESKKQDIDIKVTKRDKVSYDWKEVYKNYFGSGFSEDTVSSMSYEFVDILEDGIPEIYVSSLYYTGEPYFIYINNAGEVKDLGHCMTRCGYIDNKIWAHYRFGSGDQYDKVFSYNAETGEFDEELEVKITWDGYYVVNGLRTGETGYMEAINSHIDYDNVISVGLNCKKLQSDSTFNSSTIFDKIDEYGEEKDTEWIDTYCEYFDSSTDLPVDAQKFGLFDANLDGIPEIIIDNIFWDIEDEDSTAAIFYLNKDEKVCRIDIPYSSFDTSYCYKANKIGVMTDLGISGRDSEFADIDIPDLFWYPNDMYKYMIYSYNDETGDYDLAFEGYSDGEYDDDCRLLDDFDKSDYLASVSNFWNKFNEVWEVNTDNTDYFIDSKFIGGGRDIDFYIQGGGFHSDDGFTFDKLKQALLDW